MSFELVIAVITMSILVQAFFAGSEIALVSCDKIKMKSLAEQGSRSATLVLESYENIERFISTSLVGINLSLILSTIVLTFYLKNKYGVSSELYTVLILSPLIVLFGQVVPKAVFQRHGTKLILLAIYPLWLASHIFSPLLFFVDAFTQWMIKALGSPETPFITREELLLAIGRPPAERKEEDQVKIVRRIFEFSETRAEEVMIPLINVKAVSEETPVKDVIETIKETGHTRLPIFKERVDNITGLLHAFDLLGADPEQPVKNYSLDPFYVPESVAVDELLDDMKRNRVGMAIVVDEYGGAVGAVTIEDILEEVVGEIEDEYDKGAKLWRKINERTFLVNPKIEIDMINEELGLSLPWGDYETLSGFLLSKFGSIPKVGESVTHDKLSFTVTKASPRAVEEVKLTKKG